MDKRTQIFRLRKKYFADPSMSDDPFLGVVLVARQASSQAQVVFQYPKDQVESGSSVFGIGLIEFGKFSSLQNG